MSAVMGNLLTCECKVIEAGYVRSWCPFNLAISELCDALANLGNMAILLGKMQRAGMAVSPEMFEVLANHCKAARDALAQVKEE
jgi:hypothetical protein